MIALVLPALSGCVSFWSTAEDWDGDGFTVQQGDCADVDPDIHPDAMEIWYDGIDQDCDDNDGDADGDGYLALLVGGDDCWDDLGGIPSDFRVVSGVGWAQPEAWDVYPGADDVWYDAVDADCAGDDDFDHDLDEWRSAFFQDRDGQVGEDCIDDSPLDAANPGGIDPAAVNPAAAETWYDGTDQDCSDPDSWDGDPSHWSDYDGDGDGYPAGAEGMWDDVAEDCDDTDAQRYPDPSIEELWYDCLDQDCDGNDGDQDGDGLLAEGYDAFCADTWDAPEFFLHGELGDCLDDPDAVPDPENGLDPIAAKDIYPGGAEVWYDGIDGDCGGDSDFDMDQDGHDAVDQDNGTGVQGDDCDDMDALVNPEQFEDCLTEVDDDCTGTANDVDADNCTDLYADADEDGFGGAVSACLCEALPPYLFPDDSDCDDTNPDINPSADEYCDDIDRDCDTVSDESSSVDAATWFSDSDGDGFGNPLSTTVSCTQPTDYLLDDQDCDDTDVAVNPDATEVCDLGDNDCDGEVDEAGTPDGTAYYVDSDGDGYGDELDAGDTYCSDPGSGYSTSVDDCDDAEAAVNPGAMEICDDADTDEDCSGAADDADPGATGMTLLYDDLDQDGFGDEDHAGTEWCDPSSFTSTTQDDCDDGEATSYPGAADTWYDGVDSDCVGDDDYDSDLDGYQRDLDGGDDCDDADAAINPAATEICDPDLTDEDCDSLADDDDDSVTGTSTWYADSDGDGAGTPLDTLDACVQPSAYVSAAGDCDDSEVASYLGNPEVCDGVDNDCDGNADEGLSDVDSDGTCDELDTEECDGVDNDGDTAVDEGQPDSDTDGTCDALDTEECDGADNDGDGDVDEAGAVDATPWYADADSDGYGDAGFATVACDAPSLTVADGTDCDDTRDDVYPSADELCDGGDNDCDLVIDEDTVDGLTWYADTDLDGYGDPFSTTESCPQPSGYESDDTDCDDGDGAVYPGASEVEDLVDQDCDDAVDEDFRAVGDLVFSEVMAIPSGSEPHEEWFELVNVAGKDVALAGLYVLADVGQAAAISPEGWVLADGEAMVFCYDDSVIGVDCDYVYGSDVNAASLLHQTFSDDLVLGDSYGGLLLMTDSGTLVDVLEWTPGSSDWPLQSVGSSWVLDPGALDHTSNDDGANWCYPTSADTFAAGDFGTPGTVDACQTVAP